MEEAMKVKVDPDLCTGCELCCDTTPDVFEMKGDVAVAKMADVPAGQEDSVRESAESCPAEAIVIE
jgi:ferredoxin